MAYVRERYRPQLIGVNGSYVIRAGQMGGFLAKATGTITVVDPNGTTLVDAVPVTAGVFTPIPAIFSTVEGATVTLASNAAGTLFI